MVIPWCIRSLGSGILLSAGNSTLRVQRFGRFKLVKGRAMLTQTLIGSF